MAIREQVPHEAGKVVDMAWDPITRIVGNLGIYGRTVRALRAFTRASLNREPDWRRRHPVPTPGAPPAS